MSNPSHLASPLALLIALAAPAFLVAPSVAASPKPATSAKAPAPKKAPPRPAARKTAPAAKATGRRPQAAAPAPTATSALPPLSDEQRAIAERVYTGAIACDEGDAVQLLPVAGQPGHFELLHDGRRHHLVPHPTTSGAVRLEAAASGLVWLQIPTQSMLLDARAGRRLADQCKHPAQRDAVVAAADQLGIGAADGPVVARPAAADAAATPSAPLATSATTPLLPADPAAPAESPACAPWVAGTSCLSALLEDLGRGDAQSAWPGARFAGPAAPGS